MSTTVKRLKEELERVRLDYQAEAEACRVLEVENRELYEKVEKLTQRLQSSQTQILHSLESMMIANTKLAEAAAKIISPGAF